MEKTMSKPAKMDLKSKSITEEQKEKLRELFPEVFAEGKIDFDKLKLTLGEEIDDGIELYGMQWHGKRDCFKVIQQASMGTLKPCKEESVNFDDTENLFIEGDNLEVLKLLQKSYYGKVKMIYIDPPYNTGKEFIYPDNYKENLDTYLAYTAQVDDEGKKFSTNTETEGRFHSKWLNMMYPRIFLAKNLLMDDGVMFISIDDNEINNLRKLCDEIFGEENFLSQIIVQSNKRGQTYKEISKCHEYLLVYYKSDASSLGELDKKDGSLPYTDEYGDYDLWELRNRNPKFGRHNRPNLYFPIYVDPNSKKNNDLCEISLEKGDRFSVEALPRNSQGDDSCWRWSQKKVISDGIKASPQVLFAKQKRDGDWNIYEKSRKNTTRAKSIWADTGVISEQGTVESGQLKMGGMLEFPKPLELIKRCVQLATEKDDIVLDFFAGSATTAHAVMQLNAEELRRNKYIMVQLPEPCREGSGALKAGFKTIADIGKERIRRSIGKIEGSFGNDCGEDNRNLDLGFKSFALDRSNFNIWDGEIGQEPTEEKLTKQLELGVDHINPNSTPEDILYELLLKSGFELTTKVESAEMAGKTVYSIENDALLICLEDNLTKEVITEMARRQPARVVCLDQGFAGNDQLKTNAVQIMKSHEVEDFRTV
jgi:adenine-specific DNA-methyltransferase